MTELSRRYFWYLFIVVLACLGAICSASAQEEGRGGYLEQRPIWFAEIKTSDPPLHGVQSVYHGSGCWLSERLILTCWHNIRDNWKKPGHTVCVVDFRGQEYCNLEIVALDKKADLLLLRVKGNISGHGWCVVSSDPETDSQFDLRCYGLDTDGKRFRWTLGKVIEGRSWMAGRKRAGLWTDALVVQGMSGGPAVGYDGMIHGVNLGHANGQSQMVSLSYLQAFLDAANVE